MNLTTQLSEMKQKFGEKHPRMIQLSNEMATVRAQMTAEMARVTQNVKNEFNLVLAQEENLKKANPGVCTTGGSEWILGPREQYERQGDVSDVVFVCGHTIQDDGDTIHLYYGGADSCIALATGRVSEILAWLRGHTSVESGSSLAI